jgi:hypothetical protein
MSSFAESTVEDAGLAWLEGAGWAAKHGQMTTRHGVVPSDGG